MYWNDTAQNRLRYGEIIQEAVFSSLENVTEHSMDYNDKDVYIDQVWTYGGIDEWETCYVFNADIDPSIADCPSIEDINPSQYEAQYAAVSAFNVVSDFGDSIDFMNYIIGTLRGDELFDQLRINLDAFVDSAVIDSGNRRLLQQIEGETIVIAIVVVGGENGRTFAPTSSPGIMTTDDSFIIPTSEPGQTSSSGLWVLIVVACIVAILLIILGIWCLKSRRKNIESGYASARDIRRGKYDQAVTTTDEEDTDVEVDGYAKGDDTTAEEAKGLTSNQSDLDLPHEEYYSKSQINAMRRVTHKGPLGEVLNDSDKNNKPSKRVNEKINEGSYDEDDVDEEMDNIVLYNDIVDELKWENKKDENENNSADDDDDVVMDVNFGNNESTEAQGNQKNVQEIVDDLEANQPLSTGDVAPNNKEMESDIKPEYKIGFEVVDDDDDPFENVNVRDKQKEILKGGDFETFGQFEQKQREVERQKSLEKLKNAKVVNEKVAKIESLLNGNAEKAPRKNRKKGNSGSTVGVRPGSVS